MGLIFYKADVSVLDKKKMHSGSSLKLGYVVCTNTKKIFPCKSRHFSSCTAILDLIKVSLLRDKQNRLLI